MVSGARVIGAQHGPGTAGQLAGQLDLTGATKGAQPPNQQIGQVGDLGIEVGRCVGRSVLIAVITWVVVVLASGEQAVRAGEQCRDVGAGSVQRG
ncbi:hypothetical protein ATK30_0898 [Amycolatopsis echigonensis]|uniref:Uncharacterized protein n=1 Tax=Amycolatopsis echigonensis TaxID=2576905 RepID=A0A2N3X1A8_9PSEU|nr:hypothetical protein ATK30_0898 [Amycolatopsis niigatensis]